jgi:exodeoxyribonuclease VII small subunit
MTELDMPASDREIPSDTSYEELVLQLEKSIERLESGDLSLEEAVHEYEFGMHVIQRCNEMLDEAELRVTELSSRGSVPVDPAKDDPE